ncbi:lytic polysaccharide monooxygenase [Paenibacillus sp. 481]|uniref:lytic polysaccharide monooxygenase n=1 Tax=Paenibacillus sp. 481 TaxID=2835869 RepID=UPI001E60F74A|nr:lytic polysaccharide monooxygenase [Paenibacillus sp. 481]UHA72572.1 lytic polysaccharide monooxygenase [Paenibacillus sp. 481]
MEHHRFSHHMFVKASTRFAAFGIMLLGILGMTTFAENASAHGYIESPASRAYNCKILVNKNCGLIQYEPQSVEFQKGFPLAGPPDGKIASGNHHLFPELDQQSPTRWQQMNIKTGKNTFNWFLKQPHATTDWKYYITKQGWNSSAPLARSSFDLNPFCSVYDGGKTPGVNVSHSCDVPADRSGYHVILGVWTVHDTEMAFYQVIDVNIQGGNVPKPQPTPELVNGAVYQFVNTNSGKALDVFNGGTADGTNVQISSVNGSAAQQWQVWLHSDGSYKLINTGSGKALDVYAAGTADGSNVQIYSDNGTSAQKWSFSKHSDGSYKLINTGSGKALDVYAAGTADGSNVQIYTDNGTPAQKWTFTRVR